MIKRSYLNKYFCDVCGEQYKTTTDRPSTLSYIEDSTQSFLPGFQYVESKTDYELCPECIKSYNEWRNSRKPQITNQ